MSDSNIQVALERIYSENFKYIIASISGIFIAFWLGYPDIIEFLTEPNRNCYLLLITVSGLVISSATILGFIWMHYNTLKETSDHKKIKEHLGNEILEAGMAIGRKQVENNQAIAPNQKDNNSITNKPNQ